ncbi:MAG: hypothetical protein BroJett003_04270 [Planctomycetota bacterium]|nr:MAG: hypothetical protein BroJett003_04270 [Planctomycetota bacterium]
MATTSTMTTKAGGRRERAHLVGVVVSDKRDKTISVEYEFSVKHAKYGKYMRRRRRVHAHDEKNEAKAGDRVQLAFCRRMSKTKSWRLEKILERHAGGAESATA